MPQLKVSDLLKKINAALNSPAFPDLERIEYDILMRNIAALYETLADIRAAGEHGQNVIQHPMAEEELITDEENSYLELVEESDLPEEHIVEEMVEEPEMAESKQPEELIINKMASKQAPLFVLNDVDAETPVHPPKQDVIEVPPVIEKVEKQEPVKQELISPPLKQEPVAEQKPAPITSINEVFKASTGGINDNAQKNTAEINSKLVSTNLKELVDLNKRILFVNELFDGDAGFYTRAIDELNNCETYEKAYTNYSWYAGQLHWKPEAQAPRLLLKLLKQKFQVDIE